MSLTAKICSAVAPTSLLRIAARPPHPRALRSPSTSPRAAGRGEAPLRGRTNSFSLRLRARALPTAKRQNRFCPRQGIRGRRSAERRMPTIAAHHRQVYAVCATHPLRGRAPIRGAPAFRRYAAALAGTPSLLSSRPCFLGLGIMRALPALSGPSPVTAPHASAVIPKGMMPKAAPERVASPRGGTALAPHSERPSRRRPSMSEILWFVPT